MTSESPTAQSGPSDRAIAQAFRLGPSCTGIYASSFILQVMGKAREIDATTPPAGARDAALSSIGFHDDSGVQGTISRLRRYANDRQTKQTLLGQTMEEAWLVIEKLLALASKADGGDAQRLHTRTMDSIIAAAYPGDEPYAYACPAGCGCLWRDNRDGTMSLYGPNSRSCKVCEQLPLAKLFKVYATQSAATGAGESTGEAK